MSRPTRSARRSSSSSRSNSRLMSIVSSARPSVLVKICASTMLAPAAAHAPAITESSRGWSGAATVISVTASKPRVYVEFHHRIVEAVQTCIPIRSVHSIDEMSCRLAPNERTPVAARELATNIKRAILSRVGSCMTCSIGVAPNVFLAKVATDMQKPDGLVIIEPKDLPDCLLPLQLQDLPGIGPRMDRRLRARGIETVERLVSLSEKELGDAWGSVVGKRWWYLLRGYDLRERPTHRRSVGHQHVLPPHRRTDQGAWEVAARLLHKASSRLRHIGYWARHMSLGVRFVDGRWWGETASFPSGSQDTIEMHSALERLWRMRPPGTPMFVGVTLHDLVADMDATMPLFAEPRRHLALCKAMDLVNAKFGGNTVYLASMHNARASAPGGIAFSAIPDLAFHDSVRDRQRDVLDAPEPPRPSNPRLTRRNR